MRRIAIALALTLAAACAHQPVASFDDHAERYVKLALALGEHDADWVDAYYGPAEWRAAVRSEKKDLATIRGEALALAGAVAGRPMPDDRMLVLRRNYLLAQLGALVTKTEMLQGAKLSFDEEARRLYGVVPPRLDDAYFSAAVQSLEKELPGEGTLGERVDTYLKRFHIPADKLDAVMRAALKECRARTLQHIELPREEAFTLEYVKGQPWGAYNWYKGNFTSLIQVNTDLPLGVTRALDLACHEGYPGHHVYNLLLEKNLVRDRGWIEYSVYPLNSPQSLIAEGTGNYGLTMAFPGDERMKFDRDVLFPLAGLDPAEAERYHSVLKLMKALGYSSNEAARRWLNGEMTREQAKAWLVRFALSTPQRADKSLDFIERYRSYVINYNVGQDLVREYIEAQPDRWAAFREMLSTPMLPSDLQKR